MGRRCPSKSHCVPETLVFTSSEIFGPPALSWKPRYKSGGACILRPFRWKLSTASAVNMESLVSIENLHSLSLPELKKLEKQVAAAISSFEDRQLVEVYKKVDELAKSLGYSLRQLADFTPVTKIAVAPKYRNPAVPEMTWSGRGRKPGWVTEALAACKTLEDMAI